MYTARLNSLLLLGIGVGTRSTDDAGWEVALKHKAALLSTRRNWNTEERKLSTFTVSMAAPKYEPPTETAS